MAMLQPVTAPAFPAPLGLGIQVQPPAASQPATLGAATLAVALHQGKITVLLKSTPQEWQHWELIASAIHASAALATIL